MNLIINLWGQRIYKMKTCKNCGLQEWCHKAKNAECKKFEAEDSTVPGTAKGTVKSQKSCGKEYFDKYNLVRFCGREKLCEECSNPLSLDKSAEKNHSPQRPPYLKEDKVVGKSSDDEVGDAFASNSVDSSGDFNKICPQCDMGVSACLCKKNNFNLSEKRKELFDIMLKESPMKAGRFYRILKSQDKEFIKKLKERGIKCDCSQCKGWIRWIDKLAGEELSK